MKQTRRSFFQRLFGITAGAVVAEKVVAEVPSTWDNAYKWNNGLSGSNYYPYADSGIKLWDSHGDIARPISRGEIGLRFDKLDRAINNAPLFQENDFDCDVY